MSHSYRPNAGPGFIREDAEHNVFLLYSTTITLDFFKEGFYSVALAGDLALATSNLAVTRSITLRILADGNPRNLTFPGDWIFVGSSSPATIAAGKTGILTLSCFGITNATIVAAYAVQL